ncbi:hypothetical protein KQ51_00817 [Candidatus Izimaplasma bacterium HR1]|jgi:hypothetical protein|uniref:hypothetical protein n=1 Tax=Candidatus Izimoplasma sp. HR1 TaxID=1541959 RepID=UPI0004F60606|nr:hypothetical protein KQ51_00817 [Candidatus Izimaplasma bacterium HR1]
MGKFSAKHLAASAAYSKALRRASSREDAKYVREKNKRVSEQLGVFDRRGVKEEDLDQGPDRDYLNDAKKRMIQTGKLAKLEVLLLNYIFHEDDGRISFREKRAIGKHFSGYYKRITLADSDYIKNLSRTDNSFSDIKSFIFHDGVDDDTIKKAIHTLEKTCRKTKNYNSLIQYIKTNLLEYKMY